MSSQRQRETQEPRKAPSREFKQRQRAYLVKMRTDKKFPAPAKLVCWVVCEHWNEQTGDAFLRLDTIATESGISQTNVRNMLQHPRMPTHMRIEFGSRGVGHSNRYFPIEEIDVTAAKSIEQTGAQSEIHQLSNSKPPIEHFSPPIEQTGALNHINHNNHSAPSVARTCYVDRGDVKEQNSASLLRERAGGALDDPYGDPDFIDFDKRASEWLKRNPISTVFASS